MHHQVVEYVWTQESSTTAVERDRVVELEEHTACDCQCKLKKDQCNPAIHDYGKSNVVPVHLIPAQDIFFS